ncbi:aldose 1-epimerase family protein [Jeotgalibaca caeni]|uniref:aldose 1-epimerase family protein n=1 Tax=Jeotgalibaca caeni TaxID=3028623 RepID=UPI00237DBDCC|nr:aldose 1-epimerase family protein [Jeotgalibaca caeni]MDE1548327.1 aldose 1-epimerase family protein [Jeotgalibaca caeni]
MIILENEHLIVEISILGAELQRIYSKKENREYLWDGNPDYWSGRAPILFPVVGRLFEDHYLHKGELYELTQHGFARKMEWELMEHSSQQAILRLQATAETKERYPFDFTLEVTYSLTDSTLETKYSVQNHTEETMPYSLGSHPAFHLPLPFEEYEIRLQPAVSVNYVELDPPPYWSGKMKALETIQEGKMPLRRDEAQESILIETAGKVEAVELHHPSDSHGVRLHVKEFPYFCIWTKDATEAPFICLEPFHGIPDLAGKAGELSEKEGIILLESEEVRSHVYSIELF